VKKYLSISLAGLLCFPLVTACGAKEDNLPDTGIQVSKTDLQVTEQEIDEVDPYETLADGTYPYETPEETYIPGEFGPMPKADRNYDEENENIIVAQGEDFYSGIQDEVTQYELDHYIGSLDFYIENQDLYNDPYLQSKLLELTRDRFINFCVPEYRLSIVDTWFYYKYGEERYREYKGEFFPGKAKQEVGSDHRADFWNFVDSETIRFDQQIQSIGESQAIDNLQQSAEYHCAAEFEVIFPVFLRWRQGQ